LNAPRGAVTQALGVSDNGEVVGDYRIGSGSSAVTHGFTWTRQHGFTTVDDPGGAGTTTINGVNNAGDLVGFYVDGAALSFPAGQPVAAVAHHGVEAVGKRGDQVPDPCRPAGLDQLGLGGPRACAGQVGPDGVVEQVRVLGNDADRVVQGLQGQVPEVMTADPHGPRAGIIQPGHQVGDRGLPSAGRTDG